MLALWLLTVFPCGSVSLSCWFIFSPLFPSPKTLCKMGEKGYHDLSCCCLRSCSPTYSHWEENPMSPNMLGPHAIESLITSSIPAPPASSLFCPCPRTTPTTEVALAVHTFWKVLSLAPCPPFMNRSNISCLSPRFSGPALLFP